MTPLSRLAYVVAICLAAAGHTDQSWEIAAALGILAETGALTLKAVESVRDADRGKL